MAVASRWGITPRRSIEFECARRGVPAVVAGCVGLLKGDDDDAALIVALGGPASERMLCGSSRADSYWLRVWAVRGLLWAWDDSATAAAAAQAALTDDAWRVREMAAKVVAKRSIGDALPALVLLRAAPVVRVRAAADRAIRTLARAFDAASPEPCARVAGVVPGHPDPTIPVAVPSPGGSRRAGSAVRGRES